MNSKTAKRQTAQLLGLTVTKVVFELFSKTSFLISSIGLTVTKVVFELGFS